MKRLVLILASAGILISASPTPSHPARQQASLSQKPLQHEVSVTLKLIQVYVTDKDGKPVLDLAKDDFIRDIHALDYKIGEVAQDVKKLLTLGSKERRDEDA